jgi:hypothetical protein
MPGASGPDNCGLAYLVMTDPCLRSELARRQRNNDAEWDGWSPPSVPLLRS